MAPPALATMIPPKAQTGTSNSNPQPNCATGRGGPPGLAPSFPLRTAARPVRNRISRITGPAREVTANMPSVNSVESFIAYPDRKSVVEGKSVSVRVDLGGRRFIKKKKNYHKT